jgi:iron-sulfur cluster assembly protein
VEPTETQPRAPLTLTEGAVAQVKRVMEAQQLQGHCLTVRVSPAGCSGFGYDLSMEREPRPNDISWEQDGIKVTTDPASARYLMGTEVDFVSTLQATGFKFNNPNSKGSCGCGKSFSA